MGNCLVTKLKESVNNNNLLKLGELRLEVVNAAEGVYSFVASSTEVQKARIINGTGTFSDGTTEKDIPVAGSTFYATLGSVISIENKYKINALQLRGCTLQSRNIDSLSYMLALRSISFGYGSEVAESDKIAGNFDNVVLNPEVFKGINLNGQKVQGTLAKVAEYPLMEDLLLLSCNFTGMVDSLYNLSALTRLHIDGDNVIHGNAALLPKNLREFNCSVTDNNKLSWSGERQAADSIPNIAILWFTSDAELDAALISLANCTAVSTPTAVRFWGTRTSASDSAVAAIKAKGYDVYINNVAQ